MNTDSFEEILIDEKSMREMFYWCFLKFKLDPVSRQGRGGVEDKIGAFIDRFSNNCVNWLIFRHLFNGKGYTADADFFLYRYKSAKKSPDIIGIKKDNGQTIPFCFFNKSIWEMADDKMPFIEVKGLRKSQALAHLGSPQFNENNYFCYVETDFDEHYLLTAFKDDILSFADSMKMDPAYIKDNSSGVLISPPELEMPKSIGTIRLLGIYKGSEIKTHFTECASGVNPWYLVSIEEASSEDISKHTEFLSQKTTDGRYEYKCDVTNKFLPFYVDKNELVISKKNFLSYIVIKIKEKTLINHYSLEPGIYKVNFKKFSRSSKETEYLNYKSMLDHKFKGFQRSPKDSTGDLIMLIDRLVYPA